MNDTARKSLGPIIEAYRVSTGTTNEPGDATLADLLTDLRHWAVQQNLDFDAATERSYDHWADETPDVLWLPIHEDAWDHAELDIDPATTGVMVTAGHRQSYDDPGVYGPFETAQAAREFVLDQYQSGEFDQTGCWVTYSQLQR